MVTITTRTSHRQTPLILNSLPKLLLVIISGLILSTLAVQAQEAQETLDKGFEAFDQGNYEESIKQLTALIKKFDKHSKIPLARYLIGVSHYTLGNYKEAIPFLTEEKGEDKEFPKEVKQSALFHLGASNYFLRRYEPSIAIFKVAAAKLPPLKTEGVSERKQKLEQEERKEYNSIRSFALFYMSRAHLEYGNKLSVEKKPDKAKEIWQAGAQFINELITEFPETELMPDALMTRGTLQVYAGMFNEAEADLIKLKESPEGADIAADADYLLGYVYTQQAIELLGDFKEAEAKTATEKARKIYRELSKDDNLVVANEAAFQLANLDFTDKKYQAAIDAYRQLKSKGELIESQQSRLAELRRQVAGADSAKLTRIQRAIKREEQKLADVKANPELSNEAWIKIGEAYMQLREYNKARVVYRHATQFAEPDQKKRLQVQVIISHAAQGNADKADQIFAEFRKDHPNDPLAQSVKFLLGTALMQQERFDEAKQAFNDSLKEFPESPNSAQIPKLLAQILVQQGKQEEAIQSFRDFIANGESGKIKVSPAVIEDTKRLLAITLFQQEQHDECVTLLQDLADNAKTPAIKEEAHLQLANILGQINKPDEAIPVYKAFAETYPDSINAPKAAFQAGLLLEKQKKMDEAREVYQSITTRFADNSFAVFAYDKIWRSYSDDVDKLIEAQEELISKFPDSGQALTALFERGKIYDTKVNDKEKALETFMQVVDQYAAKSGQSEGNAAAVAAYALYSAAMVKQKQATALGNYSELDDTNKKAWGKLLEESGDLLLRVVKEFPGTKPASVAIGKWGDVLLNRVGNNILPMDEAMLAMSKVAGEMPTEQSKLQVQIAQAGMLNKVGERGQALRIYEQAISQVSDKNMISWRDLSNYGSLLLEAKEWQKALEIFQTLEANSTDKNKHAKADATYGQGAALQGLGKSAEASEFFTKLQEEYPWSPKIMEARYGTALSKFEAGALQEAIDITKEIISSRSSGNESKAKAMILMARTLEGMGDSGQTTSETKQEDGKDMDIYDLATNYLAKVEVFYADDLPLYSSEALYRAIQIRKKQKKDAEAREMLDRLLQEYGTTPWGQKARKDF